MRTVTFVLLFLLAGCAQMIAIQEDRYWYHPEHEAAYARGQLSNEARLTLAEHSRGRCFRSARYSGNPPLDYCNCREKDGFEMRESYGDSRLTACAAVYY